MGSLEPDLNSNVDTEQRETRGWVAEDNLQEEGDQAWHSGHWVSRFWGTYKHIYPLCNLICKWGAQNRPRIEIEMYQLSEYHCC